MCWIGGVGGNVLVGGEFGGEDGVVGGVVVGVGCGVWEELFVIVVEEDVEVGFCDLFIEEIVVNVGVGVVVLCV